MKFTNLERVRDYKVREWIEDSIVELTSYQKEKLYDNENVRWGPYIFYKRRPRVANFWIRLSIVFLPFAWLLLTIGLPFNFLFTGRWGYNDRNILWYSKWQNNLKL